MKALVLFSGGLDSTVLLYKVIREVGKENVFALNMSYGQKHIKERTCARWTAIHVWGDACKDYYKEMDLSTIFTFNKDCCALLQGSKLGIKHESYDEQLKELRAEGKAPTVTAYVPFRNGLFLSTAASIAYQLGCESVYYGAHKDDAAGSAYPDCTLGFIEGISKAVREGTAGKVIVQAPWWNINKAGVVRQGLQQGMTHEEFENTWSCYEGGDKPCGTCGTCIDRKEAFVKNGITDID